MLQSQSFDWFPLFAFRSNLAQQQFENKGLNLLSMEEIQSPDLKITVRSLLMCFHHNLNSRAIPSLTFWPA